MEDHQVVSPRDVLLFTQPTKGLALLFMIPFSLARDWNELFCIALYCALWTTLGLGQLSSAMALRMWNTRLSSCRSSSETYTMGWSSSNLQCKMRPKGSLFSLGCFTMIWAQTFSGWARWESRRTFDFSFLSLSSSSRPSASTVAHRDLTRSSFFPLFLNPSVTFHSGPKEIQRLRLIENHFFLDRHLKTYDYTFGQVMPGSENAWDLIYEFPPLNPQQGGIWITHIGEAPQADTQLFSFLFPPPFVLQRKWLWSSLSNCVQIHLCLRTTSWSSTTKQSFVFWSEKNKLKRNKLLKMTH